jgi:solute carrier family 25 protein 33/36
MSLKTLLQEEGIRGLYRGLGPTLVGVLPARSIYFFSYGTTRNTLTDKFQFDKESSWVSFISGTVAGLTVVTTTQPIWLVKTRMQLQSRKQDLVCRRSNPLSLLPFQPFESSSSSRVVLQERGFSRERSNQLEACHCNMELIRCIGLFCVRCKCLQMYKNSFDAVKKIWQQEGGKAFYRGMSASYLGISESVFQFVIYDKMKVAVQHAYGSGSSSPFPPLSPR